MNRCTTPLEMAFRLFAPRKHLTPNNLIDKRSFLAENGIFRDLLPSRHIGGILFDEDHDPPLIPP
jgi:hypothetical protein